MRKLLFVLFGLTSLNIYANGCGGEYQPATGTCRIIDSSGRQILYNVGKPQSSNNVSAQTKIVNIDVPSKYLALAVNIKTGMSGGALDMDSRAAAEKEAIRTCERGGSNAPCVIAASVRNGCVAVAQGKLGKKLALNKCHTAGISECKIVVNEACSMPKF